MLAKPLFVCLLMVLIVAFMRTHHPAEAGMHLVGQTGATMQKLGEVTEHFIVLLCRQTLFADMVLR